MYWAICNLAPTVLTMPFAHWFWSLDWFLLSKMALHKSVMYFVKSGQYCFMKLGDGVIHLWLYLLRKASHTHLFSLAFSSFEGDEPFWVQAFEKGCTCVSTFCNGVTTEWQQHTIYWEMRCFSRITTHPANSAVQDIDTKFYYILGIRTSILGNELCCLMW